MSRRSTLGPVRARAVCGVLLGDHNGIINGSLTAVGGMCLAMWRSKHPTMTIRPESSPSHRTRPPPATGPPRSRRPASAGNFFLPSGARGGSVKAWDD
eukprot:scaffold8872_cov118-Isochrysis_galbana.AAC.2